MYKRTMLLALASTLILSLAGCGGEPAADQSKQAATAAVKPKEEPPAAIYELTKDQITSHPDWTSKNISILGAKLGDVTRNVEKDLGKPDNTRTLPEEYLTVYQNNGIFIYTFKMTGKIRGMEVQEVFAKQIADEKIKKLLTGDLKYMRELLGPEETTETNDDDKSTAYVYDAKGLRVVQYKVGGKTLTALRFNEPKKPS